MNLPTFHTFLSALGHLVVELGLVAICYFLIKWIFTKFAVVAGSLILTITDIVFAIITILIVIDFLLRLF